MHCLRRLGAGGVVGLLLLLALFVFVKWNLHQAALRAQQAGCLMNIRNVQQGMRSYQNMNGYHPGDWGLRMDLVVGVGKYVQIRPVCPSGGAYTWWEGDRFPWTGELILSCSCEGHAPTHYDDW